jgi:Alginate lyase
MKNIMKQILLVVIVFGMLSCSTAKVTGQPAVNTMAFSLDIKSLEKNKAAIKNNDATLAEAYTNLIKDADKALKFEPVSVMEKTNVPPSGDKHDYMSLAPYFWPDPTKAGGLPYIRKDGQTNPEVKDYKDKEYMPKLCEQVSTLAMAYYFSDDNKYAAHAAKLMQVWFLDAATKMNPNLKFAQAIKGVNEGRGAGLIDSRHFVKLIDAIGLLQTSKYWTSEQQKGMQQWFADFLNWMQTSKTGIDELNAKNNHGAWYDAQRLAMALFINNTDLAKKIAINAASRLDYQADNKGFFPAEMERTISLHYTAFVMEPFFIIANMADKTGFDLWNYTSPSGKSLQKSFTVLKPYFANEKQWDGEQIKPYEFEDGYLLLLEAAKHYGCSDCKQAVKKLATDKATRLRINLLY